MYLSRTNILISDKANNFISEISTNWNVISLVCDEWKVYQWVNIGNPNNTNLLHVRRLKKIERYDRNTI